MPQASARALSTQTSLCRPPNGHVPFHSERFANLGSLLIKPTHLNTWNLGLTKDNNHFPCATPQVSLDSPSTVEKPRACFLWSRALS